MTVAGTTGVADFVQDIFKTAYVTLRESNAEVYDSVDIHETAIVITPRDQRSSLVQDMSG